MHQHMFREGDAAAQKTALSKGGDNFIVPEDSRTPENCTQFKNLQFSLPGHLGVLGHMGTHDFRFIAFNLLSLGFRKHPFKLFGELQQRNTSKQGNMVMGTNARGPQLDRKRKIAIPYSMTYPR